MIDDDLCAHRARAWIRTDPSCGASPRILTSTSRARNRQPILRGGPVDRPERAMDRFAQLTGRQYGRSNIAAPATPTRDRAHGLGSRDRARDDRLPERRGAKLGVVQVHLFRPFSASHLLDAVPSSVKAIAVLDRTKEAGASGEPLLSGRRHRLRRGMATSAAARCHVSSVGAMASRRKSSRRRW